ncbi:MAG: glycosyltransferase family 87 protein [Acidobacteriaceae bacterium]
MGKRSGGAAGRAGSEFRQEEEKPMGQGGAAGQATGRRKRASLAVAIVLLLGLCAGMLEMTAPSLSANRDFISYWAAAKLLATHGNPYDAASVLQLENAAGNRYSRPLVMRNTPTTMFLVAPLGWFSERTAAIAWEMMLIVAALASIRLLQPFCPGKVPLIVYFFAPVVDCFLAGQTTILVLLGICLFFRFRERKPWGAGGGLVLTLLKPHLLLLFWPVLLLEIVRKRNFGLLGGAIGGAAVASALPMAVDPRIWSQYLLSVRAEHIENQYFPNLACQLRVLIAPNQVGLQLAPALLGVGVALWFWWRTRQRWQWPREGALLVAGSALVSPYSFLVDQVLFLPAAMAVYPRASKTMQALFVAMNAAAWVLMLEVPEMTSPVTIWFAPALMIWCWWIYRQSGGVRATDSRERAVAVS